MRRITGLTTTLGIALHALACGGEAGDVPPESPATQAPASATPIAADWLQADTAARTVTLTIVAGQDATNNNWNFNGYANGNATVTVPEGFTVTINFSNQDPNMAHSIGVSLRPTGPWSATPDPTPVFAGAVSSSPTSMTDATLVGETETLTFAATTVEEYALVCYVPGHATSGMWINFDVVAGGEPGVMSVR